MDTPAQDCHATFLHWVNSLYIVCIIFSSPIKQLVDTHEVTSSCERNCIRQNDRCLQRRLARQNFLCWRVMAVYLYTNVFFLDKRGLHGAEDLLGVTTYDAAMRDATPSSSTHTVEQDGRDGLIFSPTPRLACCPWRGIICT